MNPILLEHLHIFIVASLMGMAISFAAWTNGFYHFPNNPIPAVRSMPLGYVLTAFGILLAIELIIVPLGVSIGFISTGQWAIEEGLDQLDMQTRGWLNLTAIFMAALGVLIYGCSLHHDTKQTLFWAGGTAKSPQGIFTDLGFGGLAWLISYPLIVMIGQCLEAIFYMAGYTEQIDQVAVKNLKSILSYPLLLMSTIGVIVIVVPLAEEMLFRGFFQNWMIQRIGRFKGILVTSLLFAGFHFSISQGWANVELLLSLFVLSCYLGFLYERQRSLWAAAGLHMAFNAFSVGIILLQDQTNSG